MEYTESIFEMINFRILSISISTAKWAGRIQYGIQYIYVEVLYTLYTLISEMGGSRDEYMSNIVASKRKDEQWKKFSAF